MQMILGMGWGVLRKSEICSGILNSFCGTRLKTLRTLKLGLSRKSGVSGGGAAVCAAKLGGLFGPLPHFRG